MPATVNPLRPVAGAPRPYHFPDFHRHRLANGLTVWPCRCRAPRLVNVHLLVDAGAAAEDEAAGRRRGADRPAARHRHPAPRRRRLRRGDRAARHRGQQRVAAGTAPAPPSSRCPSSSTTASRCSPRWSASRGSTSGEFDRLKAERLADILQARADPGRLADEMFLRQLFDAATPYRRLVGGHPGDGGGADPGRRPRLPGHALRAEHRTPDHRRSRRARDACCRPQSAIWATGAAAGRDTGPSRQASAAPAG